jgi:hypothetical protein
MVIAILIVTAMVIYTKVTTEPEKFTALYILGANGKADNYSTEVSIGEPSTILVGVENYEYNPVNYTLRVSLGGKTLREESIILDHGSKWLNNITFIPQLTSSIAFAGENKSKLEFQLLKDNKSYRSVHLLVNASLNTVKFAELPNLINGDMESNEGWLFFRSSQNITGSYINETISSRVYNINFTSDNTNSSGIIYQNLATQGDALAMLSFDVRDSGYSFTSYFAFKQALLDGQVIWESGLGSKNNSWEHVEIPVLLSGNNSLALRVYSEPNTNLTGNVWWDNVKINPLKTALPQFGDAIVKDNLAIKIYGWSNIDNLSLIKLSIENLGITEKNIDISPPVLIDDLGNQYGMASIQKSSLIKVTPLNPGVLRKGTIVFNPINNSAKHLRLILYLNGEKCEFGFPAESKTIDDATSFVAE